MAGNHIVYEDKLVKKRGKRSGRTSLLLSCRSSSKFLNSSQNDSLFKKRQSNSDLDLSNA